MVRAPPNDLDGGSFCLRMLKEENSHEERTTIMKR
jgi:hypothetical protein